jgi:hypothetical protein
VADETEEKEVRVQYRRKTAANAKPKPKQPRHSHFKARGKGIGGYDYIKKDGKAYREVFCRIKAENREWLSEVVAEHYSTTGKILDEIIEAVRAHRDPTFTIKTPYYVVQARKAERRRRERMQRAQKERHEIEKDKEGPTDSGGDTEF